MRVKPAKGLKVRHPDTFLHIPEEGIEVSENDTRFVRLLANGDLVLASGPQLVDEKEPRS